MKAGRSGSREFHLGSDSDRLLQVLGDVLLELYEISSEPANAVGKLLGRHGILVEHPPERLLVHLDFGDILRLGRFGRQLADELALGFLQLPEQFGRDGQEIAAR